MRACVCVCVSVSVRVSGSVHASVYAGNGGVVVVMCVYGVTYLSVFVGWCVCVRVCLYGGSSVVVVCVYCGSECASVHV